MIDPVSLAVAAGSGATAIGALLVTGFVAIKNKALKAEVRRYSRIQLDWLPNHQNCRCSVAEVAPKQQRIPAGQPGAGRYIKAS